MMSAQTRLLIVCGVLIAVPAASLTALAMSLARPAAGSSPRPAVLTLAASSTGNTVTVVGVGIGSAVPNQAQLALGVTVTRPTVREAVSAAGSDTTRLVTALHNQGAQDKDIQTSTV